MNQFTSVHILISHSSMNTNKLILIAERKDMKIINRITVSMNSIKEESPNT